MGKKHLFNLLILIENLLSKQKRSDIWPIFDFFCLCLSKDGIYKGYHIEVQTVDGAYSEKLVCKPDKMIFE